MAARTDIKGNLTELPEPKQNQDALTSGDGRAELFAVFGDQVVSPRQAARLMNLSQDTLRRLHRQGRGPPRLSLSTRRKGYRIRDLREYLESCAKGEF